MGTLTLVTIRNLVRSELNETGTTLLGSTELDAIINDGQKDTAIKGLCYENKIAFDNIAASQKIVPLLFATNRIIRVNYVEYKSGATEGGIGLLGVLPQAIGWNSIDGNTPKHWFQWGDCLVVEPLPDVGTYDLAVYATCCPAAAMSADDSLPASLPVEFHECVYLFALAYAALKLKRWGDAANAYNRYIAEVQRKRYEYIMKYPDSKATRELPDNVTKEDQRGR